MLGMAAVGVDRSFDMLWVDLYRLNILNGPVSPRGVLLRTRLVVASDREGSRVLALESSWNDGVIIAMSLLPSGATISDEELP